MPNLKLVFRKRAFKPGSGVGLHVQKEDEIYYVLSGKGTMTLDGKTVDITPGTAVLTRTGSSHSLKQVGDEDLVILINYEVAAQARRARQMIRAALLVTLLAFGQWPQFRGPDGNGVSTATGLPLTWSETQNVRWKTRDPRPRLVVAGRARPPGLADDGDAGRQASSSRWRSTRTPARSSTTSSSSTSPRRSSRTRSTPTRRRRRSIEPGRVYVTFGSPGTAAIDTATGKVLWERRDLECNHFRGAGSSPIIFRDLLLMHFDGSDVQYVVALDKRTGKTVWKTDRSVDFQDLDAERQAQGGRRLPQGVRDAADRDGRQRQPGARQPRIEGRLRLRPADRQGALAGRGARPTFRRARGRSSGNGLVFYPTGFNTAPDARGEAGRHAATSPSTHVAWRRHARRAEQAVDAAARRPALSW